MNRELAKILSQDSLAAAPLLLGWQLVRGLPAGQVRLKIVEAEAYHQNDPASHSFRGRTNRTWPMFEAGGHLYVYFTYGMHHALNLVTGPAGVGEGVLIRAGEPISGIDIMWKNRYGQEPAGMPGFAGQQGKAVQGLANGPGKLAQALGLADTKLSGQKIGKTTIWLVPPAETLKAEDIIIGPRIGVSRAAEAEARFYIKNNRFVSKL